VRHVVFLLGVVYFYVREDLCCFEIQYAVKVIFINDPDSFARQHLDPTGKELHSSVGGMCLPFQPETDQVVGDVDFFFVGADVVDEKAAGLEIYVQHILEVWIEQRVLKRPIIHHLRVAFYAPIRYEIHGFRWFWDPLIFAVEHCGLAFFEQDFKQFGSVFAQVEPLLGVRVRGVFLRTEDLEHEVETLTGRDLLRRWIGIHLQHFELFLLHSLARFLQFN